MLCTDGLFDLVPDDEIRDAVVAGTPPATCERLVARARASGGYDNITGGGSVRIVQRDQRPPMEAIGHAFSPPNIRLDQRPNEAADVV